MTRIKWNTAVFIELAAAKHVGKYSYPRTEYAGQHKSVTVTCPIHGDFTTTPQNHIRHGAGCDKCARTRNSTDRNHANKFLDKLPATVRSAYDFSSATYVSQYVPVEVVCPQHGSFFKSPKLLWRGQGCPHCFRGEFTNTASWVEKAKRIHGEKYTYERAEYSYGAKITITCPTHGDFAVRSNDHLDGGGCQKCSHHRSRGEEQLKIMLEAAGAVVEVRNRTVIAPKELDLWLPQHRIGIEFNGLYYHSNAVGNEVSARRKHVEKTAAVEAVGARLIHISEHDLVAHRPAVEHLMKIIIGAVPRLGARECTVRVVTANVASAFLDAFHIQGSVDGAAHYGLLFNGGLVAVASFKPEYSSRHKKDGTGGVWELARYASSHSISGGMSKLAAAFFSATPTCNSLVSYADLAVFTGGIYTISGWELIGQSGPDYKVFSAGSSVLKHKSTVTKTRLKKQLGVSYDSTKTERELCLANGIYRYYDCGKKKFILHR